MTEPVLRPVKNRRELLRAASPTPRPQGPLGPDALAKELERLHYRRSPWDEWLDRYRGADVPDDGGAGSWEQDHPPRPTTPS